MEKWCVKHRPEQKVIPVVYFFRFGRRINSQINVTTATESVSFAGQTFCIQRDGMLMAGFSSPLVSMSSSCFISSGKAGPVVRICIAEQASDTGAVGKVMQAVTLLHQTCPETGRHGAGQPTGAVVIVVGKHCPGECV